MKCALCGKTFTKEQGFTNPESHEPGCPIWADGDQVTQVIKEPDTHLLTRDQINKGLSDH